MKLRLYTYRHCPFCDKVRRTFKEMGVVYQEVYAERGTEGSRELLKLGGKQQVPFLLDEQNEVMMYESDEIINYAREHFKAH